MDPHEVTTNKYFTQVVLFGFGLQQLQSHEESQTERRTITWSGWQHSSASVSTVSVFSALHVEQLEPPKKNIETRIIHHSQTASMLSEKTGCHFSIFFSVVSQLEPLAHAAPLNQHHHTQGWCWVSEVVDHLPPLPGWSPVCLAAFSAGSLGDNSGVEMVLLLEIKWS